MNVACTIWHVLYLQALFDDLLMHIHEGPLHWLRNSYVSMLFCIYKPYLMIYKCIPTKVPFTDWEIVCISALKNVI